MINQNEKQEKGAVGRIHSIQSMGTLDGPGVRFVIFTQGCPLRCKCCHNPDTWDTMGGTLYRPEDLVSRALRFREYFGKDGGVTVSGGEPLLQPEFVSNLFELCHDNGINTCLDTSGCILTEEVKTLLNHTDRVLLDIKYTSDADYRDYVGCGISAPLAFLDYLETASIPTTLRQVIIPSLNDTEAQVLKLKQLANTHTNVDKVELLPFRKICQVKYDNLGTEFPLSHVPEPSRAQMYRLEQILRSEN
ncbi:MAG: pyruvate formate lyase-activating protein [Clostridia bacterium]|nr:pyruvate formate lyase-activating protein [Clostridia bacterium]